jgi:3-deoxy-7-phosphoheptulonate synthase
MTFEYQKELPSAAEIIDELPIGEELATVKKQRDRAIAACLKGESNRFIIIIGPCSAHDEGAVCDYVSRLAGVAAEVKEKLVLIPRIYTNKPRTTGTGYKGMLHQPDPNDEPNMVEGIRAIRRMHIRALKECHLTAADEMLYPGNHPYLDDVLSYVAVGARSTENQQHRLTASGLEIPVGIKNPMSGDFQVMLNSVSAAQAGHVFSYNNWQVKTTGNDKAHAILRGAFNRHGNHIPNYHFEHLMDVAERYGKTPLKNPAVIVDTNHSNSGKRYREQPRIALEILHSRGTASALKNLVKGLMIESFIEEGSQGPNGHVYGKSITDPCLGWEETRALLLAIADKV